MIEGNDGGACVSFNGGQSWSSIYNQPTAQLYHVIADDRVPYRVYASQQDNTAISIPSASPIGAIAERDWVKPGGGESGYIAIKRTSTTTTSRAPPTPWGGASPTTSCTCSTTRPDRTRRTRCGPSSMAGAPAPTR